jgi:hypothetical protein
MQRECHIVQLAKTSALHTKIIQSKERDGEKGQTSTTENDHSLWSSVQTYFALSSLKQLLDTGQLP